MYWLICQKPDIFCLPKWLCVTNDMEKWNLLVNSKRIKRPNKLMFRKESLRQCLNAWFQGFLQDSLIVTSMHTCCDNIEDSVGNKHKQKSCHCLENLWGSAPAHWGGCKLVLTLSKNGLRRHLKYSNMSSNDAKCWRLLWWCAWAQSCCKPFRDNKRNGLQRHLRYLKDVMKYISPIQAFETYTRPA